MIRRGVLFAGWALLVAYSADEGVGVWLAAGALFVAVALAAYTLQGRARCA